MRQPQRRLKGQAYIGEPDEIDGYFVVSSTRVTNLELANSFVLSKNRAVLEAGGTTMLEPSLYIFARQRKPIRRKAFGVTLKKSGKEEKSDP